MVTPRLLALDLGTRMGWALSHPCISGVEDFRPRRFESSAMRYVRFGGWLARTWRESGFSRCYFEEVRRHLGVDAAHAYGGYVAVLTTFCEDHAIPYGGVPVGTIKKHATGKGNADKNRMVAAARARGWNVEDDNEADALFLLDLQLVELTAETF